MPQPGAQYTFGPANGGGDILHLENSQNQTIVWFDSNAALNNNNSGPVLLASFGGNPTASHGIAAEIFHQDFLNQAAAITSQTVYTVPANRTGFFRVIWLAKVTQVAQNSSVLGGGSAFQVTYTDGTDGTSLTTPSTAFSGNADNALTTQGSGEVMIYAASGSAIQVNFGYTSSGSPAMQYILHVRIEDL